MNNIIEVKKLVYSSDNKKILDNISFDVKYGEFVTFICNEASGKSTLCKILSGLIITNSSIKIDNIILNESNSRMIRKNISTRYCRCRRLTYCFALLTTCNIIIVTVKRRFPKDIVTATKST